MSGDGTDFRFRSGTAQLLGRELTKGLEKLSYWFQHDPNSLQKLVGVSAGTLSLVVGCLNLIIFTLYQEQPFGRAIGNYYVWASSSFGLLCVVTSFWGHPIAKWFQVFVCFAGMFLNALTSSYGELTSALFLIFGIVLLFEYHLPRVPTYVVTLLVLSLYPAALSIGYSRSADNVVIGTLEAVLLVGLFVILYGAVYYLHYLQHRQEAELLESRVSERTKELQSALDERSVMLQEIHHRVKNNLQVIASLLNLEARKISDEKLRKSTENSIRRIHAMALVHETLYQSEPLHAVDLEHYARRLAGNIQMTLSPNRTITVDVTGSLRVGPDFAVPFGLVLSELVSNSARHAFPGNRGGRIRVELRITDHIDLTVSDDGVGMGNGEDLAYPSNLGLQIVKSLVNQLSGHIELSRGRPGTAWIMSFPKEEHIEFHS